MKGPITYCKWRKSCTTFGSATFQVSVLSGHAPCNPALNIESFRLGSAMVPMTEILHHPHRRHNIDVGGRGGLQSTTTFLYNRAPLLAHLGGGARFLPSTVSTIWKLRSRDGPLGNCFCGSVSTTCPLRQCHVYRIVAGSSFSTSSLLPLPWLPGR